MSGSILNQGGKVKFICFICLLGLIAFEHSPSIANESVTDFENFPIEIEVHGSDYVAGHSCTYVDIEVSKSFGGENLVKLFSYSDDDLRGDSSFLVYLALDKSNKTTVCLQPKFLDKMIIAADYGDNPCLGGIYNIELYVKKNIGTLIDNRHDDSPRKIVLGEPRLFKQKSYNKTKQ
jgi:hypothetical protein